MFALDVAIQSLNSSFEPVKARLCQDEKPDKITYRSNLRQIIVLRSESAKREGLKEKGALMLVPSTAVESMGMGGLIGAAAMRQRTLTGAEVPSENSE